MIGTGELIVILIVVLVLFGGKKLPELAKNLGVGVREFKRAVEGLDKDVNEEPAKKVEALEDKEKSRTLPHDNDK